jgi:hypothetical protein
MHLKNKEVANLNSVASLQQLPSNVSAAFSLFYSVFSIISFIKGKLENIFLLGEVLTAD